MTHTSPRISGNRVQSGTKQKKTLSRRENSGFRVIICSCEHLILHPCQNLLPLVRNSLRVYRVHPHLERSRSPLCTIRQSIAGDLPVTRVTDACQ